jgi:ATP-binding cassette subfamily B protein
MYDPDDERVIAKDWRQYLTQAKEIGKVLAWMWRELGTDEARRRFKHLVVALTVMTMFKIAEPRMLTAVFDGANKHVYHLIVMGLGGFFFCVIAHRATDYLYAVAREWILGLTNSTLDERITKRFFEKSLGQHIDQDARLSPENISTGRERVLNVQSLIFFEAISTLVSLLFSYLFLWSISLVAGSIITVVILGYGAWMLYLNQQVFEVCSPLDKEFRSLKRYRVERWKNVERVKTCGKEEPELAHMTARFDDLMDQDRNFWIWFIGQATFRELFGALGLLIICGYGTYLVWTGQWFIGLLYPLVTWSVQVTENIWRIGHIERQFNYNMPAIRSLIDALSIVPDITSIPNAAVLSKEAQIAIAFENITHTYPLEDEEDDGDCIPSIPVLKNVSFSIAAGEKVALIGPSGSGKTTLMKLLLRFMDPSMGTIRINGTDLRAIDLASWMRTMSYIPQHAQILDGTIRYNLTYGLSPEEKTAWDDDHLWQLMHDLCINFAGRLTKGLDTVVGERGVKLSGGQAQRMMIGAAAIQKPPFMIIDEATSHLDSSTERAVHEGLKKILAADVGALIIAHRLSTVEDLCNRFVVLREPSAVGENESQVEAEATSFKELYSISPTFRRLADDQHLVIA